jgi:hypothetical protein
LLDLTVPRDWCILAVGRIYPNVMIATVVAEVAALFTQVLFQLAPLHL